MSTILHYHRGRVALHAILAGLRVRTGDEVILQAFTSAAVVEPLLRLGVRPVYADIDRESFGPDPDSVTDLLTDRTRAVIVQHTFGIPVPVEELDVDVPIIEDCSQVTPGLIDTARSAAAFYSFEWDTPVTAGLGGTAVVHDPELASTMRDAYARYTAPPTLRELLTDAEYVAYRTAEKAGVAGRLRDLHRSVGGWHPPDPHTSPEYGWRMAIGTRRRLTERIHASRGELKRRRELADAYEIELHRIVPGVPLRFPAVVADKEQAIRAATAAGLELGGWYATPVHPLSGSDLAFAGYRPGSCPNAEWAAAHVVTWPVRATTRRDTIGRAADLIARLPTADSYA